MDRMMLEYIEEVAPKVYVTKRRDVIIPLYFPMQYNDIFDYQ